MTKYEAFSKKEQEAQLSLANRARRIFVQYLVAQLTPSGVLLQKRVI